MNNKSKLEKQIKSINEYDFNSFKDNAQKMIEESETVEKLYKKFFGYPIPKNRSYVEITFGRINIYPDDKGGYSLNISLDIHEYFDNHYLDATVNAIDIDNDIKEVLNHFGLYLRSYQRLNNYDVVDDYIRHRIDNNLLDEETYKKLRNIVKSFV